MRYLPPGRLQWVNETRSEASRSVQLAWDTGGLKSIEDVRFPLSVSGSSLRKPRQHEILRVPSAEFGFSIAFGEEKSEQ